MSRKRIPLTNKDVNEMLRLYNNGMTIFQLQQNFHRHQATIIREFRNRGVRIRGARVEHELRPHGIQEFVRLWNSGRVTSSQIGKRLGISKPTVKRLRQRLGLEGKRSPNHPRNIEIRLGIKRMHREGMNDAEMGKRLEIDAETIRKYRTRMGFSAASRGGYSQEQVRLQIRTVVDLAKQGHTVAEIRRHTGWGKKLVANRLRQGKVRIRDGRVGPRRIGHRK